MKRSNKLVKEYKRLAFEVYKNARICVKCYTTKNICVHHKDEDIENNKEKNLQILCRSCHTRHHSTGKTFNRGRKHSLEFREKMRLKMKGKSSPMKGKKHTKETIDKIKKANSGKKHFMYGKHHSKETINKIKKSNIGLKRSEETRKRISEASKGRIPPNKGKIVSKEIKEKISKANRKYEVNGMGKIEWMEKTGKSKYYFYKLAK